MRSAKTEPISEDAHVQTADAVCQALGAEGGGSPRAGSAGADTKPGRAYSGLGTEEAARRLEHFGPNELSGTSGVSVWKLLLAQFRNVLILILLAATLISAFLGHGVEAVAICAIVLFAVVLGFAQEYRAERAVDALRRMAIPLASVLRDGLEVQLPARELVPGDLILLVQGQRIAADGRLLEAANLEMDEAALTGESNPVGKDTAALDRLDCPLGDRNNMVYAGTAVAHGRGRAIVVATGMNTEFGRIARMLQTVESGKTPLQHYLDKLGRVLAWAALVVVAGIVGLGLIRGQDFLEILLFGIALAVAVVPEALPAVVTISLALGVQQLIRQKALMRRLSAVEALGSTSVICSDKTGTLTRNEMFVRAVHCGDSVYELSGSGYAPEGEILLEGSSIEPDDALKRLLSAAVLASDAHLVEDPSGSCLLQGDPTEGALLCAAEKAGLKKEILDSRFPRIAEIPFESETRRMVTIHRSQVKSGVESEADPSQNGEPARHNSQGAGAPGRFACAKGAPEAILDMCKHVAGPGQDVALDEAGRNRIREASAQLAGKAMRVLAVADRPVGSSEQPDKDMTFLGLLGLIDPPRPEAAAAVRECMQAGIRVIMITGDHPVTAEAIARELGLLRREDGNLQSVGTTNDPTLVLTGAELDGLNASQLEERLNAVKVYARVSPAHKLQVVTALQKQGQIVAMTGDGVNDAPALKKADIGVAMGLSGTDVAREAAAMTLMDDNFATLVAAVESGRGIFANIRKYLMFLLSSNIGEIGLIAGAALWGLPMPLSAVQILYVNLLTDGLPALALALDPAEPDLMSRKPRKPNAGIFTRPVSVLMLTGGLWSVVVNLGLFVWALSTDRTLEEAMTMTFVSLVLIQFFKAYNFRSDRRSVLRAPFANRWLNLAVLVELALLALIVYIPVLQIPFGTFGLTLTDWAIIGGLSLTIVPVLEIVKGAARRGWLGALD